MRQPHTRCIAAMICLASVLQGCADVDALDFEVSDAARAADYPRILPLSQLPTAPQEPLTAQIPDALDRLNDRASKLRARARQLSQPVLSDNDALRLGQAGARGVP